MLSSLIQNFADSRYLLRYGYVAVDTHEEDAEQMETKKQQRRHLTSFLHYGMIFCFSLFLITIVFLSAQYFYDNKPHDRPMKPSTCRISPVRREWRSLSQSEKAEYVDAVLCLRTRPSKIRPEGLLYDDFPYIHARVAKHTHGTRLFLPWHRYFLNTYEEVLQNECHYNGTLTYWDWTLDWNDLNASPVFSSSDGFGSDGDASINSAAIVSPSVGHGHCVTDGPFANLSLPFFNSDDHTHCLSRGFHNLDNGMSGHLSGAQVRPEAIEKILNMPDYEAFYLALEKGPHNAIPNGIRGDFIKFTAPNDPLFFLHHTQLDRTWWRWQQGHLPESEQELGLNKEVRNGPKKGKGRPHILAMSGLAMDRRFEDVLKTESDLFCYRY